jgi:polyhydroxybutyrate depolymerase
MNHRRTAARLLPVAAMLLMALAACGSDDPPPGPSRNADGTLTVELGDRPFKLFVPESYSSARPAALVIGLHGYTSHAAELESYFGLMEHAQERGFLYAMPDGTRDRRGDQFWNATNACCDFYSASVDDSGYLSELIETVEQSYTVDRVFVIGHSNGGYMAHRFACDHAEQLTAIASLAGPTWADPAQCTPARPVSVLQIHGTADATVAYAGGQFNGTRAYPGAEETVARWREIDGCTDVADTAAPPRDLDDAVSGPETTVTMYVDGCADGTRVELWRMQNSGHVPLLTQTFTSAVMDFFLGPIVP